MNQSPEKVHTPLDPDALYAELDAKIRAAGHPMDLTRIRAAYDMAKRAHEGQLRKDGSPYVTHCVAAADISVDLGLDEDSICAALLHDVIEDTGYTLEDLAAMGFPQRVTQPLALLTHRDSVPYLEYVAEIKKDPVARAVKLADLRHNSDLSRLDTVDEKALERVAKYKEAIALLGGDKE